MRRSRYTRRSRRLRKARLARAIQPASHLVKHRWNTSFLYTVASVTTVDRVFNTNFLWQPDYTTGASHAAMGWLQWASLYENYIVIGSKITWKISGFDVTDPVTFACFTSTVPTALSNLNEATEQNGGKVYFIGNETGGRPNLTLTQKWSAKKWTKSSNVLDNEQLMCVYDAEPVNNFYYHLVVSNPAAGAASFLLNTTIEFTVIWREPRTIPIGPITED